MDDIHSWFWKFARHLWVLVTYCYRGSCCALILPRYFCISVFPYLLDRERLILLLSCVHAVWKPADQHNGIVFAFATQINRRLTGVGRRAQIIHHLTGDRHLDYQLAMTFGPNKQKLRASITLAWSAPKCSFGYVCLVISGNLVRKRACRVHWQNPNSVNSILVMHVLVRLLPQTNEDFPLEDQRHGKQRIPAYTSSSSLFMGTQTTRLRWVFINLYHPAKTFLYSRPPGQNFLST